MSPLQFSEKEYKLWQTRMAKINAKTKKASADTKQAKKAAKKGKR